MNTIYFGIGIADICRYVGTYLEMGINPRLDIDYETLQGSLAIITLGGFP